MRKKKKKKVHTAHPYTLPHVLNMPKTKLFITSKLMTSQVIYLKITVHEETTLKYGPKPMQLNALTVLLSLN